MRNYITLDDSLHSTAESSIKYFSQEFGLKNFQIETEIQKIADYVPTFFAETNDYHLTCVDVSDKVYNPTRWHFISNCEKLFLPVKFFVALPNGTHYGDYIKHMKEAKKYGVGIVEINSSNNSGEIINKPLSLSLTGLRKFEKQLFQKKYREIIINAEETFKSGDPNKACSIIYDEIESLTRSIAIKTHKKRLWKQPLADPSKLETESWAKVVEKLKSNLDRSTTSSCASLTDTLLSQVHGITNNRNQSSHKPKSRKELIKRDTQLRTRMETAVDIFHELINASKILRP